MAFGSAYPPPRPLPPRSAWTLSPPIPDNDHLRTLAAADPGMTVSRHAQRSPVRQPQWAAARAADRAEGHGQPRADSGPEIAAEPAPFVPGGPVEPPRPYVLDDPASLDIPRGNPGADIAALLRRRLTALATAERPLGIHPPAADLHREHGPLRPADPGPHDQEPAVPRWRWWRRALTSWRTRGDRKEE